MNSREGCCSEQKLLHGTYILCLVHRVIKDVIQFGVLAC